MAQHSTGGPDRYAVATGNITGRIPHDGGAINVTDEYLFFDTEEEAQAVAESIGLEHAARGTHPVQLECPVLSDRDAIHPGGLGFTDDVITAHQAAHKALNKKAGL